MVILLACVLLGETELPTALAQEAGARRSRDEIFGLQAFYVHTEFDEGLKIEDGNGVGVDLLFRWQWNEKARFGFTIGGAAIDAEIDTSELPIDDDVDVRQFRAGVGAEFPFSVVEIGLSVLTGAYRFRRDGENDTSPFVDFAASLGFRPHPMFKIGGFLSATHTQSSFNRDHTHLFHNYNAGLMVELTF